MVEPHRATPEQWALVEQYAEIDCYSDSVALELRDRLAALEDSSRTQEAAILNLIKQLGETNHHVVALQQRRHISAATLKEAVMVTIAEAGAPLERGKQADAVLTLLADWLDAQNCGAGRTCARWLREEVERG